MANAEDSHIKLSHLTDLLKRIEWEAKLVRLALLQLDPATTFKVTPEIDEHLKARSPIVDNTTPPC